jgi:Ser/Thr protein kinase RdoA (MazF antagonist)
VAAVLEHSQVAHYLLSLGVVNPRAVVDGDLVVTNVSRRNTVFLARTSTGPAYVVKEAGPSSAHTLAREAAVLRGLAGEPAIAALVPELVAHDAAAMRLVLRSPAGGLDWGEVRRYSPASARLLGRALASIHDAQVEVDPLADGDRRLWGLTLPEPSIERLRSFSSGAVELLARVQADDALCGALARLGETVGNGAFAHGDVRWENCLLVAAPGARRRTRPLLIDWEHAGPGVPAYDVGSALAEYLRSWIESIPEITPDSDPSRFDAVARLPLARVRPATAALWSAYRAAGPRPPEIIRVAELAGVRLLETAFEFARGASFVSGHVVALVQLAANMVRAPGFAAWNLLGLRE